RLYGPINAANELAVNLTGTTLTLDSAGFAALAKEIGIARRSLSANASGGNFPESGTSGPLSASVRAIFDADLGSGSGK
ncbi:MAG: hypothetical protein FWF22_11110, partial [Treponema sp.]|nr:hypothetical protein [Treponema sp.]